ncbi:MAG: hypothetical protein WCN86_02810 [bacterium]
MKKKNSIITIASVVIAIAAIALLYRYIAPPTKDSNIKYSVPHPVNPNFNSDQLKVLNGGVVDYSQNIKPQ